MLLDLNLPYWSGFEVLEWIRQQPQLRRLPVVIFTSSNRPDDIARAYDAGANGYLVKPNALADLTRWLWPCATSGSSTTASPIHPASPHKTRLA